MSSTGFDVAQRAPQDGWCGRCPACLHGGGAVTYGLDRLSVDEVLAGGPVREFRWYRGRKHYSGWYWSATTGGLIAYESRLELSRIMLADFDPEVVGIAAQPIKPSGPDDGVPRRHVPDLLLKRADGGVLVVGIVRPDRPRGRSPQRQAVCAVAIALQPSAAALPLTHARRAIDGRRR